MFEEYKEKKAFVEIISEALSKYVGNIEKVEYELYQSPKNEKWITEFVIVHYKGGATQPRCVSGNSNGANYEEIGKMLYSSQVFNDKEYYKNIKECSNRIDLEAHE